MRISNEEIYLNEITFHKVTIKFLSQYKKFA